MSAQPVSLSPAAAAACPAGTPADGYPLPPAAASAWQPAGFSTAMAAAVSQLVVRYWQDCTAHAEFNPARPIDVIDLAPGNGTSGHQLIRALAAATRHSGGMRFRYLPVVPGEAWMRAASAAPEMVAWREQGRLLPLVGEPDLPGRLKADGKPFECHNPVVILAHDGWAHLSQRLLAVHYGKLLEADLELIRDMAAGTSERPDWRPVQAELRSGAFAPLFDRYLDEFNSTPISYPEGALAAVRRWRRAARHGYLLLASGCGMASELNMRLHTFPDLVTRFRDDGRLPVNFGLIAHWARLHGAATTEWDLPGGRALQIVMEAMDHAGARLASLAAGFDPDILDRQALLAAALLSVSGAARLEHQRQLLRLSAHDPMLLAEIGRDLAQGFSKSADFDRAAWRKSLDETWANFLPELSRLRLHERLANAAMHCGHWQLARQALLRGIRQHGSSATDLANLAWCEMRTGQLQRGQELVGQALALAADNPLAQQVAARLQERLSQRDHGWLVELRDERLPLILEPLDLSHADAYFVQYRDPQIAIMTGLPPLKSVEETREWIRHAPQERGRVSFAVMHQDHGFVAYVNLAVSSHAAFFCFWTGVDFQGQGFATAAARLVFRHALAMGVPLVLTSAYKDNRRSVRALERLGFVRLASQALPPDQDRIFFALVDPSLGAIDAHRELTGYYEREGLPIKFAGQLADPFANLAANPSGNPSANPSANPVADGASTPIPPPVIDGGVAQAASSDSTLPGDRPT